MLCYNCTADERGEKISHPAEHLRKSLEDLLEEFEVDLVLSGHVHAYARTCNVFKEHCIDNDDGGTTHITLGMLVPHLCRTYQVPWGYLSHK